MIASISKGIMVYMVLHDEDGDELKRKVEVILSNIGLEYCDHVSLWKDNGIYAGFLNHRTGWVLDEDEARYVSVDEIRHLLPDAIIAKFDDPDEVGSFTAYRFLDGRCYVCRLGKGIIWQSWELPDFEAGV